MVTPTSAVGGMETTQGRRERDEQRSLDGKPHQLRGPRLLLHFVCIDILLAAEGMRGVNACWWYIRLSCQENGENLIHQRGVRKVRYGDAWSAFTIFFCSSIKDRVRTDKITPDELGDQHLALKMPLSVTLGDRYLIQERQDAEHQVPHSLLRLQQQRLPQHHRQITDDQHRKPVEHPR